jgi:hypothetical protein
MAVSPLTQHRLSYAYNYFAPYSSFFIRLDTFHQIPMAYTNNTNNTNDANFYPLASGEFDAYRSQMSAVEQENIATSGTFTNGWNVGRQPGYVVGSPISLKSEASSGKYDYSPSTIAALRVLLSRFFILDAGVRS